MNETKFLLPWTYQTSITYLPYFRARVAHEQAAENILVPYQTHITFPSLLPTLPYLHEEKEQVPPLPFSHPFILRSLRAGYSFLIL